MKKIRKIRILDLWSHVQLEPGPCKWQLSNHVFETHTITDTRGWHFSRPFGTQHFSTEIFSCYSL